MLTTGVAVVVADGGTGMAEEVVNLMDAGRGVGCFFSPGNGGGTGVEDEEGEADEDDGELRKWEEDVFAGEEEEESFRLFLFTLFFAMVSKGLTAALLEKGILKM